MFVLLECVIDHGFIEIISIDVYPMNSCYEEFEILHKLEVYAT